MEFQAIESSIFSFTHTCALTHHSTLVASIFAFLPYLIGVLLLIMAYMCVGPRWCKQFRNIAYSIHTYLQRGLLHKFWELVKTSVTTFQITYFLMITECIAEVTLYHQTQRYTLISHIRLPEIFSEMVRNYFNYRNFSPKNLKLVNYSQHNLVLVSNEFLFNEYTVRTPQYYSTIKVAVIDLNRFR